MAYGRRLYSRQVCSVVVFVNMLFRRARCWDKAPVSHDVQLWTDIHAYPYPWQLCGLRFRATARSCLDIEAIVEKDSWLSSDNSWASRGELAIQDTSAQDVCSCCKAPLFVVFVDLLGRF